MAKKKLTRKERIVLYLIRRSREPKFVGTTCANITRHIIKIEKASGNVALYMSGSVSTKLQQLVKSGEVEVVSYIRTERNGRYYRIK